MSTIVATTDASLARAARAPSRPGPTPRPNNGRLWDVGAVVGVNALIVVGLWLRHGGLDSLNQPGGAFTATGQLTGLIGTYAVLVQILLMSRIGWIERFIGLDRLVGWHRWTGFASVTLLVGHA